MRKKRSDTLFCSSRCRVAYHRKRNKTVTDTETLTILSLCDYSGNWSKPYLEAGYNVIKVDLQYGDDVRLFNMPGFQVHGILAAPPCTYFAISGARWKRSHDEIRQGLSVVDACLRIITMCSPVWWALENPVGTLKRYIGEPTFYFQPCDYGDPYTKKTCLWGKFTPPKPQGRVMPISVKSGHHRIDQYWKERGETLGKRRQMLRSVTPLGFAYAFFAANP